MKLKIWSWSEFHDCACRQCKERSTEWAEHVEEQRARMERKREGRIDEDLMKMREKDVKDIVQKLEIEKPKK
ncbi:hypothetical protein GUITHDRAFT_112957 [Guillardia theta CCMP2712]|uniref:Uncharacterized protein n=1 Tax=Guillardia theta (strain CCMP2712) TaxID=905079 RepID=L1IXY0_GUITC|nr:hypothetical protein GUITHDRAFT_112957 [Guillardia theta CCMP2712]EKX40952.1 hypothetical protein GUITHDRAFT_112957 [Guillardia theta CCMP2712]|eukprot:XP_005827932.1 hypothetical protein GUITHDRAFT_112957 [Guillardia theta CCMP2712]